MQQVAEALDCTFVYALVPRTSLEDTLRGQARIISQDRIERAAYSMLLEAQSLSAEEQQISLDSAIDELVRKMPKELWDNCHPQAIKKAEAEYAKYRAQLAIEPSEAEKAYPENVNSVQCKIEGKKKP